MLTCPANFHFSTDPEVMIPDIVTVM
jgi:hypothetical protein